VTLTIRELVSHSGLNLSLVAGSSGVDRAIRWVHTSELSDPTPWLTGGELLLTTGMAVRGSAAAQRAYIRRLVSAGLTGLGFGLGFGFDSVPGPILRAADREGFPVLEVPYPVPFIAIAEAVSKRISEDRMRDAQMSMDIHDRLASLVAEGAGLADVLDEMTELAGGWALLFDVRGGVLAASSRPVGHPAPDAVWKNLPRGLTERTGPTTASEMGPGGATVAMAVVAGKRHEGVLVFGKPTRLQARDRFVVRHAVTVLGLLLASRRAVVEAERRIAGDILSEAFAGRLSGPDLVRRLELVGFSPGAPVAAIVLETEAAGGRDAQALDDLAWALDGALGSRARAVRTAVTKGRITALVSHERPELLAEPAMSEVTAAAVEVGLPNGQLRLGVGERTSLDEIRHSYLSAVLALRAAPESRRVASPRDLGSYALLLGGQPRPVLENFVRSVLGPLIERDEERSSELVSSVRAYIEAGGRWEPGAETIGVHRHTLRYRVRQSETLLERDLSTPEDRLEVWLALKALDILGE
jgi:purine catabolism regulator